MRRARSLGVGRLPLLLLLVVGAALIGAPSADPAWAQSPAAQSVPSDWALIPEGLEPGDSFRLIFVTSTTRDASSTDIADYNAHAQSAAASNSNLSSFSGQFRALISTSAVDARDNTATTGTGVPVHWLGGAKVADDYSDLYDGDWDSVSGKTEGGSDYTGLVWTGGNKAGLKSGQRHAGAAEVRLGDLSDAALALSSPSSGASSDAYPVYAISPVILVAEPESDPTITAGPTITSTPASGESYGKGETISVSITFSEAVTVTGEPRLRIEMGERKRFARYSAADGATLTFAYTVRGNDRDADGVSIGANRLALNGGTIADADGNAAVLEHPALADQSGHRVHGAPTPADDPDRPGVVSLQMVTGPEVGTPITALLLDPDGGVADLTWQWQRSADRTAWVTILGATGAEYTPTTDDAGQYLRVTASYTDNHGPGKSAAGTTDSPVVGAAVDTSGLRSQTTDAHPVQSTVWSTTLTAVSGGSISGCDPTLSNGACSRRLGDATFTYKGTSYTIESLVYAAAVGNIVGEKVRLRFSNKAAAATKSALGGVTLKLSWTSGSTPVQKTYAFVNAGIVVNARNILWDASGSRWSNSQEVSVSLIAPQGISPPGKPAGLSAKRGDGKATLSWANPKDRGITKYQYQQKTGTLAWPTTWTDMSGSDLITTSDRVSYTVTGLTNTTAYRFRIRAVAGESGPQSSDVGPVPSRPKGLQAKRGDSGQVELSWWKNPADFGISGYQYQQRAGKADWPTTWTDMSGSGATTRSHTVTMLTNGTEYSFRIRAMDHSENSPPSSEVGPVTPISLKRPQGLAATGSSGQATLSWINPGDSTITGYEYQQRAGTGPWGAWTGIDDSAPMEMNAFSYTVMGLTDGTIYAFRIRAVKTANNVREESDPSAPARASVRAAATTGTVVPTVTGVKIVSCPAREPRLEDGNCPTTAGDTYAALEPIRIEVTFSKGKDNNNNPIPARIAVEGRPTLALHVSGTATEPIVRYARFMHLTSDNTALFEYLPLFGDRDDDGISFPENALNPVDRIYDRDSDTDVNPAYTSMTYDSAHKVNGLLGLGFSEEEEQDLRNDPELATPALTGFRIESAPASNKTYALGEEIRIRALFSENNTMALEGWPKLKLQVGSETEIRLMEVARLAPTWYEPRELPLYAKTWILFTYTVRTDDIDQDGISIPANPFVTSEADRIYNTWSREPVVLTSTGLAAESGHKVDGRSTTEVWKATMTVDADQTYFGCDNRFKEQDDCSKSGVLSDTGDEFTHGNKTYKVRSAYWDSSRNEFVISFTDGSGTALSYDAVRTALAGLVLTLNGTTELAVSSSREYPDRTSLFWPYEPISDWTDGVEVTLKLLSPP